LSYEQDFLKAIEGEGYKALRPVTANGSWHRLIYEGEKRSSGRYRMIVEGDRAISWYGSDKDLMGFQTWRSWDGETLDSEKRDELRAWQAKKDREHKALMKKREAYISKWMGKIYANAPLAPDTHKYCQSKEVLPEMARLRVKTGELMLPVYQDDGSISSLQLIAPSGFKKFVKGAKVKDGFCPLSEPSDDWSKIYICEGYSTASSVRQATKHPVIAAYNAGNLRSVARRFRKTKPDSIIVIASDNDQFPSENWPKNKKWVNTGTTKAHQAAGAVGGFVITPEFDEDTAELKPTDFNDYACIYGHDALKEYMLRLTSVTPQAPASPDVVEPATLSAPSRKLDHTEVGMSNWSKVAKWKDGIIGGVFDVKYSTFNADLYLSYDPKWFGTFVYDEFQQTERIVEALPWDDKQKFTWRDVEDTDLTQLRGRLSLEGINIGSNTEMSNILKSVALKKTIHPVQNYFDKLIWDGNPRLDDWLIDYCDATTQPKEYVRAVGSNFIKASVKRIYNAGEKFDHVIVFEGHQSAGKSTLLEALATFNGESYFTDSITFDHIGGAHLAQHLKGKLIVEFAELSGLSAKDRNKVKSWISSRIDEVMPKFSNSIVKLPRQFIVAGSTNDSDYLNDPTGGRRFWPIKVGKIKLDMFNLVKEQIWAEAIHRVKAGELHYIETDDPVYIQATQEQASRFEGHVWEDIISSYVSNKTVVTTEEILIECLVKPRERWSRKDKADIAEVMRGLGWDNKPKWDTLEGKSVRKWRLND